jgi:hypothetical protein
VAAVGSRAVLAGKHAQWLVREATFLLVAASRPEIKDELLARAVSQVCMPKTVVFRFRSST